jgi:hypothetical protein
MELDIAPDIFQSVLEYIYSVKEPDFLSEATTLAVLKTANHFDVKGLKLLAESKLTYKFLSLENAPTLLLFADSNCCPLLKEAALRLGAANAKGFKAGRGYDDVKKSPELLAGLFEMTGDTHDKNATDPEKMDVLMLRKNLENYNLDVDGTRDTLVYRLKDKVKASTKAKCPRTTS